MQTKYYFLKKNEKRKQASNTETKNPLCLKWSQVVHFCQGRILLSVRCSQRVQKTKQRHWVLSPGWGSCEAHFNEHFLFVTVCCTWWVSIQFWPQGRENKVFTFWLCFSSDTRVPWSLHNTIPFSHERVTMWIFHESGNDIESYNRGQVIFLNFSQRYWLLSCVVYLSTGLFAFGSSFCFCF